MEPKSRKTQGGEGAPQTDITFHINNFVESEIYQGEMQWETGVYYLHTN